MNALYLSRLIAVASAAGLAATPALRAQEFDEVERSGWGVRLGAAARFNTKVKVSGNLRPVAPSGDYHDGFIYPSAIGTSSGKTWNWGYDNASQISGGQLALSRFDNLPVVPSTAVNPNSPIPGGELIGSFRFMRFKIRKRAARFGVDLGYGYSQFSESFNLNGQSTASYTTDSYDLGGVTPPPAPYAGTPAGPGPLISLQPVFRSVTTDPSSRVNVQGQYETTMHHVRFGPWLEVDLSKRFGVAFGAGYSSIYASGRLTYSETITVASAPVLRADPQITRRDWRTGVYAEILLNYRFNDHWGVYLGGDLQHNNNFRISNSTYEVDTDLGATYAAKAGVSYRF